MSINNTTQNLKNSSSESLDWNLVQKDMKSKLGSDIYESWLRKIDFVEEMSNYILLSVSTRFIRDWITSRYLDQILQVVKVYKKDLTRIEFKIIEKNFNDEAEDSIPLNKNKENVSFIKDTYLQYNRIDPIRKDMKNIRKKYGKSDYIAGYSRGARYGKLQPYSKDTQYDIWGPYTPGNDVDSRIKINYEKGDIIHNIFARKVNHPFTSFEIGRPDRYHPFIEISKKV